MVSTIYICSEGLSIRYEPSYPILVGDLLKTNFYGDSQENCMSCALLWLRVKVGFDLLWLRCDSILAKCLFYPLFITMCQNVVN